MLKASLLWILLASKVLASAEFEAGIKAYDQADFAAAQAQFQAAYEATHSTDALFNLGNAFLRQGKRGEAIAAYLGARDQAPGDPDVRANLEFALKGITDQLQPAPASSLLSILAFWKDWAHPHTLLWIAGWLWALGMVLGGVGLKVPAFAGVGRGAGGSAVAAALVFLVMFGISQKLALPWGAVVSTKAPVYSGPGEHNTVVFELREGAPIYREQEAPGFVQIGLSDGKVGWMKSEDARFYGDAGASGGNGGSTLL